MKTISNTEKTITNSHVNQAYKQPQQYTHKRALIDKYGTHPLTLSQWMLPYYHFGSHDRILEVGCGTGEFWHDTFLHLKSNNHLTLTDQSLEMLTTTKSLLNTLSPPCPMDFKTANIDSLPFPQSSFDIILAHLMIYHAKDAPAAITHIHNILSDKGWFSVTTQYGDSFQSHMQVAHETNTSMPQHCIVRAGE